MSMPSVLDQRAGKSRDTRGRVPVYRVALNDVQMEGLTINEFSLSCSEGNHDAASLSAQSTELEDTEGMINSVISFRFGIAPHTEVFYGYVVDVKEEQGSQGALTFTLSLLGPTKMMYEALPNFWVGKTVTGAVKDLAAKNFLGYAGHSHPFVWQALAKTSESDWAYVNKVVKRVGYVVFNRYGVVMSYDPVRLFKESGIYTRFVSGTTRDVEVDRYLIDFEPSEISDVEGKTLGTKYGYFSSGGTPQIGTQPGQFKGYIFDSYPTIRNESEAETYIKASDIVIDGWKQHAMARIWGDADVYPGHCVEVVTTNKRFLRNKYDGKWLVRATQHQMDRQQYQTLLYLTRPEATPTDTVPYRAFWLSEGTNGRARPTLALEQQIKVPEDKTTPPGRWVSSWVDRTLRSIL